MFKTLDNKKGFSLVELLICLAILGVVLTAVYKLFISANKSQVAQDLEVEMQQNARSAADFLVREMRNISTISCLDNTTTACSPDTDKIIFTSMSDSNTRIFSWSATDNILQFSAAPDGSPNRQPLTDNITALTLSPYDAGNNSTTTLGSVQRIDISLTTRTARPDPNTGTFRTYSFKTSVVKRN
jgi:type IV pilus assembly protein PilW